MEQRMKRTVNREKTFSLIELTLNPLSSFSSSPSLVIDDGTVHSHVAMIYFTALTPISPLRTYTLGRHCNLQQKIKLVTIDNSLRRVKLLLKLLSVVQLIRFGSVRSFRQLTSLSLSLDRSCFSHFISLSQKVIFSVPESLFVCI